MYDTNVFPFRVELVGAWVDHPFVSGIMSGSVVTVNVINDFKSRSGLASSSRDVAKKLWPKGIPLTNLEENSKLLFDAENTPEKEYISGSEDHIGILYPGVTRTIYSGAYWPIGIDNLKNSYVVEWLKSVVKLIPIVNRYDNFNPKSEGVILDESYLKLLCESGDLCWEAILTFNIELLGEAVSNSYLGKTSILPATNIEEIEEKRLELLEMSYGVGISGAGGGGYLTVISDEPIDDSIELVIRN